MFILSQAKNEEHTHTLTLCPSLQHFLLYLAPTFSCSSPFHSTLTHLEYIDLLLSPSSFSLPLLIPPPLLCLILHFLSSPFPLHNSSHAFSTSASVSSHVFPVLMNDTPSYISLTQRLTHTHPAHTTNHMRAHTQNTRPTYTDTHPARADTEAKKIKYLNQTTSSCLRKLWEWDKSLCSTALKPCASLTPPSPPHPFSLFSPLHPFLSFHFPFLIPSPDPFFPPHPFPCPFFSSSTSLSLSLPLLFYPFLLFPLTPSSFNPPLLLPN